MPVVVGVGSAALVVVMVFLADHLLGDVKGRFGLIHWASGLLAVVVALLASSTPAAEGSNALVIVIVIGAWGVSITALAIRTGRRQRRETYESSDGR